MKLHSQSAEFLLFFLILLLFILPPLVDINPGQIDFLSWKFPFPQFVRFFFALSVYVIYKFFRKENDSVSGQYIFYSIIFPSTFCFGILFSISLFIKAASILIPYFIKIKESSMDVITQINLPEGFIQTVFCILNFFFAAFFEEVIYRFYLPEFLIDIVKTDRKIVTLIIEFSAMMIFAFSHLNMGLLSVLNAGFAHICLRLCYKKTGNIYSGFIAHFFYNIISLYLL